MSEAKWVDVDMSAHAFRPGQMRSICGLVRLPVGFHRLSNSQPRCRTCQRGVVRQLSKEWAAAEDPVLRWREHATRAVMGENWTYDQVTTMPSWLETVDRVAVGLAEAFREGLLQGTAAARTEPT